MRRVLICCLLGWALSVAAQSLPALSPDVRAFVKSDAPILALTHVRIIDGTGAAPNEDQTIVIRHGRLSAIGKVQPPADAQIIDLAGRTVLPGLVGMHDHLFFPAGSGWFHQMGSDHSPLNVLNAEGFAFIYSGFFASRKRIVSL